MMMTVGRILQIVAERSVESLVFVVIFLDTTRSDLWRVETLLKHSLTAAVVTNFLGHMPRMRSTVLRARLGDKPKRPQAAGPAQYKKIKRLPHLGAKFEEEKRRL